jgi:DNA repair protein RadC
MDIHPATDLELLAGLLRGSPARRVATAHRLLAEAGSLHALRHFGLPRLRLGGVSAAEARGLTAAFALGARAIISPPKTAKVDGPDDAYTILAPHFAGFDRERFVLLALDTRHRRRAVLVLAEGGQDACPVDAREVFRAALREGATAIILAHNHPSGDPLPSEQDLALTERLARGGALLGVALLDHLIVGRIAEEPSDEDYCSLARMGLLPLSEKLAAAQSQSAGLVPSRPRSRPRAPPGSRGPRAQVTPGHRPASTAGCR